MKSLVLSCLLLSLFLTAHAQSTWHNPLPVDSITQRITYSGVVEVPGANKSELYSRAREWFTTAFGSSKAVLEMDDGEVGKLIGNAYAEFGFDGSIGRPLPWAMWRKIKVELKDGRYRYSITDFGLGGPLATPDQNIKPLDSWLSAATRNGKQPGKMVMSVIDGAQLTGQAEVASLRSAMSKKVGGDW